ncbi:MAG: hypothetical protein LBT83_01780 [Tannerella sp.]|jgi:hypothetical protein|nr:hypothetical protein [Tannerella sp.]
MARRKITTSQAICIISLWFILCYLMLTYSKNIDFYTVFVIVASAIIVFVPICKSRKNK